MNKFKITLGNYSYGIRKTTSGMFYIVRSFSHKGYKKWQAGKLLNKSGIISL